MNNRKIIAFMLSLTILCPVGSIAIQNTANTIVASATSQTPTDESYFTINSDGTLMKYTGTATNVVIPSTINGINVTSIGYPAFRNNSSIKSIVIPKGVTYISGNAFYNCVSLTSVEIPEGITKIEFSTFRNCKSLTSIKIPQGVLSINDNAFNGCSSLRTVEIPNSVKKISVSAFESCTALTSIEIPEGVTSIDGSTFKYCTSLTNVKISNSVTSIGSFTFYGCTALKSIKIPNSVTSIDSYAFYNCQALTSMEIPSSVTSIGEFAFNNCTSLASIEIPNSVTSIGQYAFYNCQALTSIEIPSSVTYIGNYAFINCDSLNTVYVCNSSIDSSNFKISYSGNDTLPENIFYFDETTGTITKYVGSATNVEIPDTINGIKVTAIGSEAFKGNTSIQSVVIPEGVTFIGDYAFQDCTSIKSIEIPNSVTSIGNYTFNNCTSIKSIEIPSSVTSIGNYTFNNCTSIKSIEIPNSVTSIGNSVFNSCTALTSIKISNSVTSIGDSVFNSCTALTSIEIPNSVTSIGNSAFNSCTALTSIEIPNSVTSIGNSAFNSCTALTSIEIPNSVIKVGENAFDYCDNLQTIIVDKLKSDCTEFNLPKEPPTLKIYYNVKVSRNCSNLTSSNLADEISSYYDYTTTLTANDDYTLPSDITVKVGDTILKDGYTFENGVLTISKNKITDDITIEATGKLKEYSVTSDLTNIKSNGTDKVSHGKEYKATLTADDGYNLPSDITIKVGDTVLKDGYTFVDGVLTISGEKVTGNITIEATGKLKEYSVTSDLTNIKSNGTDKVSHGKEYKATLTADDGYNLPSDITIKVGDTVLKDGYTFVDGVLTISGEKVTGNITIEATGKLKEYSVTSDLTNIKSNGTDKVSHGKEYKATLTADDGYNLPSDITIKVGDTVLKDGYTFVDGVLTISGEKVTGNITINAIGNKKHTSIDLLRLKKHILGISTIEDITSLDLNDDDTLNILDVIAFKNKLLNE